MLSGAFDMVSGIFRSTMWNQTVPDALRGRLAGIELLSFSAGPQLGQVRSGGVASLTSVRTSVWSGGLACVAGVALLAAALPQLLAYDARTSGYARAVREARGSRTAGSSREADDGPEPPEDTAAGGGPAGERPVDGAPGARA
ncbi:hypothetical protein AN220_16910 [Streptomyces nanshensis]|nr:hypothetical protein AN220_16910 [Streptomyces nanshensis]